uniref:PAP2_C domain-containing protein n=1 Tax=Syphacia muris TaxID=451379 RepID=A0A0N5AH01_9BILA
MDSNEVRVDLSQVDAVSETLPTVYDRFPRERWKTLVAFSMLVLAAICNDLVLSFIHERVPQQPALPDLIFSLTPYIPWGLSVSEYIILALIALMFTIALVHRYRWIVLRRIFFIASLLYFGRCITMLVTQVPVADPNYPCAPRLGPNHTITDVIWRGLRVASSLGLNINGKIILCGDYIYSGHTVVLAMTCLFIIEYSPRRWKPLHFLSILVSLTGAVFLILSRGHYTVDVVISYYITTRVFWMYHTLIAHSSLKEVSSSHNHLAKLYWHGIFRFMEGNVHKPLPRK